LIKETVELQAKTTILHDYRAIYFKLALLILTMFSRAMNLYLILALMTVNLALLLCVGARKLIVITSLSWFTLSSVIILLNIVLSTFKVDIVVNLIYAYTTFTSLALFYVTTPPRHIRKLLGFNVVSLTYLFMGYSARILADTINALRARGLNSFHRYYNYKYLLRAFMVILVTRITEVEEALKARGVGD
jgi:hypothetical protein